MQLAALCSLSLEGIIYVTINNLHLQMQMAPVLPKILSEWWRGGTRELLALH